MRDVPMQRAQWTVHLRTSFTSMSQHFAAMRSLPNKFLSAEIVMIFSSTHLIWFVFAREANVFKFNFYILLQKDTSSLSILCLLNFFASSFPALKQSTSCSAASCSITRPVAMFRNGTESSLDPSLKSKGFDMVLVMVLISRWTSLSSLFTLWEPVALWVPILSESSRSQSRLVAAVSAAHLWLINHLSSAEAFCVKPTMPPLVLLSRLIVCSKAMSAQTWLKGWPDLLTGWLPFRNSL